MEAVDNKLTNQDQILQNALGGFFSNLKASYDYGFGNPRPKTGTSTPIAISVNNN
jgi:hypothetical protein